MSDYVDMKPCFCSFLRFYSHVAIEAIEKSVDYVQAAIRHAHPIAGKSEMTLGDKTQSYGPVNHAFGTVRLAIEPPSKYNRHPFTK